MDAPQIQDAVLVSLQTFNDRHASAMSSTLTLPAGQSSNIALASRIDVALYDMRYNRITVTVLDEQAGSPTNGFYIDASAVVTVGWRPSDNTYRIVNNYNAALVLMVNIILEHKAIVIEQEPQNG